MDLLNVLVTSSHEVIWEGKARSVSSTNIEGPFDILPQHATFVTIVENHDVRILDAENKARDFHFDRCVIFNRANKVSVYTQI